MTRPIFQRYRRDHKLVTPGKNQPTPPDATNQNRVLETKQDCNPADKDEWSEWLQERGSD
jgi:hypothetical protein